MKIGIDCRIYGSKHTGIGRYVQNLVENLLEIDKHNEYVLFVNKDFQSQFLALKVKIVPVDIPHYSLKEQIILPRIIKKEKLDLVHFPHFNVPMFYSGKYVVTIHDLIKHFSKGPSTTTRKRSVYWLKYLGYKIVFKQTIKRADKIITPSNFVKNEIINEYKIDPEKISVTYEGVDTKLKAQNSKFKTQYEIKKPYLLYVGSVYPHKNIERLIKAVKLINKEHISSNKPPVTLVIVCARNVFRDRLNNYIEQNKASDFVSFTGYVADDELAFLYQEAEAFVFPTLSEGFGLPGLEAMAVSCPVLCSDILVLREIYGNAVIYFNPLDSTDIAEKIKEFLSDEKGRGKLKLLGSELVKKYSWQKMANETLKVYKEAK